MNFSRLFLLLSLTWGVAVGQDSLKKINTREALSAALSKVQPDYSPVAKQLRVQGEIDLEAEVGESGLVEKVTVVRGNPLFAKSASEALKKWRFKPFTENGAAIRVIAPIRFSFKL